VKLGLPLFSVVALGITLSSVVQSANTSVSVGAADPSILAHREEAKSLYAVVVRGDGDLKDPKVLGASNQLLDQISKDGYDGAAGSYAMVLCKYSQFRQAMIAELPTLFDSFNLATRTTAASIVQVMDIDGFSHEVKSTLQALKASDAEIDLLHARFIEERL
jgi:hypothetical protein